MENIFSIFTHQFAINAFAGALLASIACGIIGAYVVANRLVFVSGGISHASFGGIGFGYYIGVSPLFAGTIFAVFAALGIEVLTSKLKFRSDSAIAILWSAGMALGVFFIAITPGYAPNLMTYLFGNILTITNGELGALMVLDLLLIAFFSVFYYPILFLSFDEGFLRTRKFSTGLLKSVILIFIAVAIVLNVRLSGIILVMSLLTIPQETANLLTSRFDRLILLSVLFSLVGCFMGLIISFFINIPSGPVIVLTLAIIYFLVRLLRVLFRKGRIIQA